jgi:hypothetical protein
MKVRITKLVSTTTIIECDSVAEAPFALAEHEELIGKANWENEEIWYSYDWLPELHELYSEENTNAPAS